MPDQDRVITDADVDAILQSLPDWQAQRLALLLDALIGVEITEPELRTLTWLSGWEQHTITNLVSLIGKARKAGGSDA